jgi:UDP-2,3-diacylglucosamine pyrophosphatase LpxH
LLDRAKRLKSGPSGLPVQQEAPESLVEIISETGDRFLQDVHGSTARLAVRALMCEVVVQDFVDGMHMRKGDELMILGDVFPIVDEQGFDVVGDRNLDRWPIIEVLFLNSLLSATIPKISELIRKTSEKAVRLPAWASGL